MSETMPVRSVGPPETRGAGVLRKSERARQSPVGVVDMNGACSVSAHLSQLRQFGSPLFQQGRVELFLLSESRRAGAGRDRAVNQRISCPPAKADSVPSQ
jgi:hypothetical protein